VAVAVDRQAPFYRVAQEFQAKVMPAEVALPISLVTLAAEVVPPE
jgi:hypothetical protein